MQIEPSLPKHHLFAINIDWSLILIIEFIYCKLRRAQDSNLPGCYPNLSLASRCHTTLPALPIIIAERKGIEPLSLIRTHCFQDSFLDQPDPLLCVSTKIRTYYAVKHPIYSRAQTSGFGVLTCCGWRKTRTFNLLLNRQLLCHWAIHPFLRRAEEPNFFLPVCSRVHQPVCQRDIHVSWPGETRTHNPPVKSRILCTIKLRASICN